MVLLHGSMEAEHSHLGMARSLAGRFTVHLPDRRGRGMSGPYPAGFGMRTEVEDLAAVLAQTQASSVFGVSSGRADRARGGPCAARHPQGGRLRAGPYMDGTTYTSWLPRYDREMAQGKVAAALVTSMAGLRLGPPLVPAWPADRGYQGDDEEPG